MFSPNWLIGVRVHSSTTNVNSHEVLINLNQSNLIDFEQFKHRLNDIVNHCEHRPEWEWSDKQYVEAYGLIRAEFKKLVKVKILEANIAGITPKNFDEEFIVTRGYYSLSRQTSILLVESTPSVVNYLKQYNIPD